MTMDKNTEQMPFTQLRAGHADCPSDLALDRLQAGELSSAQTEALRRHVADCALCPQRMSAREAGFANFKELDERQLLASIRRGLAEEPSPSLLERLLRRMRVMALPLSGLAVAAVAALVLLGRPGSSTQPMGSDPSLNPPVIEETREKGGPLLQVYRLVDGRAQPALSGDTFKSGDRLRFVVDLPAAGQAAVLGVEPQGGLYVAWPSGSDSGRRPMGKRQELPGAVALDASMGKEVLYLVWCPAETAAPAQACKSGGPEQPPRCPAGCQQSPFVMNKK